MSLSSLLSEPDLQGLDLEDPERIKRHAKILSGKRMLREVFADFYHLCIELDHQYFGSTPGRRVELGAGVSLFKVYYPEVFTTDIKPADHLDAVADAQATGFADSSVRALYGLNCFHHFPDPAMFFKEALRVLHPGGGCILLDPYYGPAASFMYKRLFATESFDKSDPSWSSASLGAMQGANQALTYIVFKRDRERFEREFPEFEMLYARPVDNYLRYLFSGGLNFRQLLPDFCIGPLRLLETLLTPINRLVGLHHVIVLRKRNRALPNLTIRA